MKLVLGCGNKVEDGAVNHDKIKHSSWVDVAHDLNEYPWPWKDNEFDEIYSCMVFEHLTDFLACMNECHRILKLGGVAEIILPHYESPNVPIDPTHVRGFHIASMDIFDMETKLGQSAWYYTDKKWTIVEKQSRIPIDSAALRWKMVTV